MKKGYAVVFAVGLALGSLLSPVVAAIMPSWEKENVRPVVMVKYDGLDTFKPVDSTASFPPTWKTGEVTPMAQVVYQGMGGTFVAISDTSQFAPAWKQESVTPWVEVVPDQFGDFTPRYTR
jgi:hypothetical protein